MLKTLCRDCQASADGLCQRCLVVRLFERVLEEPSDWPTTEYPTAEDLSGHENLALTVEAENVVGDYELLVKIDEGGMGVVWRCRDHVLHRDLAMKSLLKKYRDNTNVLHRFQKEALVMGELQHPGIVPIHKFGTLPDGRPYFVMKLVKGEDLAAILGKRANPSEDRPSLLTVLLRVAQTLAYAHARGVINRDLKPKNVMVGEFGEVQVMDWGLAKILAERAEAVQMTGAPAESDDLTQDGDVMGTLPYMPPEQARGLVSEIDRRSDVFGLGAILCAILTGQPPYVGSMKDVMRQAREAALVGAYARLEACGADAELIALAKRCLAVEKDERPQDAGEVARAVATYLADVENRARKAEQERAAALAREEEAKATVAAQRRAWWLTVGLAASVGLLLLATGVASVFKWQGSETELARLKADRDREEAERRLVGEQASNAIDKALTAAMGGDLEAAERAIADAEGAGASPGQVRMLRGQIALHRGKTQEAMRHLEQAVRLLPESVAAQAMLAAAYAYDGQWEKFDATMQVIDRLSPSTAEDYLFKGYAEANLDPERGLRSINEAFRLRPKLRVGRLLRAEVRSNYAQDKDDLEEARLAVEDARSAKELMEDNPVALWVSLEARLAKAGVHEHRGEEDERRAELKLAEKDALALERHSEVLPEAVVYRWLYFREMEREEEILEELRLACERTDHVYVAFCYALTLYRRGKPGDFEAARLVLQDPKRRLSYNDRLLPFVLAERDYDSRLAAHEWQKNARKASEDFAGRTQDGAAVMHTQAVLCLLGKKKEAVKASKALLKQPERLYALRREPMLRCLRYNASDLPEDDLVRGAEGSRWDQCLAHFEVAMTKLAEGDREGAREHFDKVVKTRAFIWGAYDLSWVYLARLKKDPNWPPWIEAKRAK